MPKDPTAPQHHHQPVAPNATERLRASFPQQRPPGWLKAAVGAVLVLASGLAAGLTLQHPAVPVTPAAPSASAPPAPAAPITPFAEPANSAPVLLASSLPASPPEAEAEAEAEAEGSAVHLTEKPRRVRRPRPHRAVSLTAVAGEAGPATGARTRTTQAPAMETPAPMVTPVIEEGPFSLGTAYPSGSPAKANDLGLRAGSDVRYHGEGTSGCRVTLGSKPAAQISIDGTPVGATPLLDLRVPCGRRTIVWKSLTDERRQQVLVQPGATVRRWVSFQ